MSSPPTISKKLFAPLTQTGMGRYPSRSCAEFFSRSGFDEKATVSVGNHGVDVDSGKGKAGSTHVNIGHRCVTVSTRTKKKGKTTVNVGPNFIYQYAATETQIHDNRDVAVFFLMNDLRPGTSMKLHFTRTSPVTAFLPRSLAKILPFYLKKLPEVLSVFSIRSNSVEAEAPKKTLRECEEPAAMGESRYCATSLESMVDFSTSQLKTRNVLAISTDISKEETPMQHYTITPSRGRDLEGEIDETDGRERVIGFLQNSSIFSMSIYMILQLLFFLNVINLTNIECFNSTHNRINCS